MKVARKKRKQREGSLYEIFSHHRTETIRAKTLNDACKVFEFRYGECIAFARSLDRKEITEQFKPKEL